MHLHVQRHLQFLYGMRIFLFLRSTKKLGKLRLIQVCVTLQKKKKRKEKKKNRNLALVLTKPGILMNDGFNKVKNITAYDPVW